MLVVISDAHSTDSYRLTSRTLDVAREASLVVRAGDFVHEPVLNAFIDETGSFLAVYGDNGGSETRNRIPTAWNTIYGGVESTVTHTHRGGNTALSMSGRKRGADVVVSRHSYRPGFHGTRPIPLLNLGNHA